MGWTIYGSEKRKTSAQAYLNVHSVLPAVNGDKYRLEETESLSCKVPQSVEEEQIRKALVVRTIAASDRVERIDQRVRMFGRNLVWSPMLSENRCQQIECSQSDEHAQKSTDAELLLLPVIAAEGRLDEEHVVKNTVLLKTEVTMDMESRSEGSKDGMTNQPNKLLSVSKVADDRNCLQRWQNAKVPEFFVTANRSSKWTMLNRAMVSVRNVWQRWKTKELRMVLLRATSKRSEVLRPSTIVAAPTKTQDEKEKLAAPLNQRSTWLGERRLWREEEWLGTAEGTNWKNGFCGGTASWGCQARMRINSERNEQATMRLDVLQIGDLGNPEPDVASGKSYGPGNVLATLADDEKGVSEK